MVQTPRFCTGCGHALPLNVAFCTRCGKPVRGPAPTPAVAPYGAGPVIPAPVPVHDGPLQAGSVLHEKYLIEKRLGSGGMGKVYLARHRDLQVKTFAVKEMSFEGMSGSGLNDAVERFFTEAETMAALSHPNIPQIFERFEYRGRYFMVMEFVEGTDLEKLLDVHLQVKGAPLPEAAVVRLAFQLLDALDYLHHRVPPVIHRDIKPANAIVAASGRAKLVDFGIARATGRRHTQAGTVGYAPREQYEGATEPRSDIYSLGATLHHLVTGRTPIPFDFPPCSSLGAHVSPEFEQLISEMVAMAPDGRPASARAVWKRLQQIHPEEAAVGPGDSDALLETIESLRLSGLLPAVHPQQAAAAPQSPPPAPVAHPPQAYAAPQPPPPASTVPPVAPSIPPASGQLICPACQKPNRLSGRFCTNCGATLTGPR